MSLYVCLDECFILDSRLAIFLGRKLSFRFSACSVLFVVPLFKMRPFFPLVSWTEGVR